MPVSGWGDGRVGGVSTNAPPQESIVAGSDRRKTLEFQLQHYRGIALSRAVRHIMSPDQPDAPAAAAVLEAAHSIDRSLILQRIDLAREYLPGRRQPPGSRDIPLFQQSFAITVAHIDDGIVPRPVLDARLGPLRVRLVAIPFHGEPGAPVPEGRHLDLANHIRGVA